MANLNLNTDGPIELQKTGKRDALIEYEKKYQERWKSERIFEVDAPTLEESSLSPSELHQKYPKWMGTFPYPYMNGSLHLGHAFTISKIEFNAGFQRMLGKRTLFPMGFHCTGMPIKAAADKLVREIEMFGPNFERYTEEAEDDGGPETSTTATSSKGPKAKVAAKATGLTYQFQILESIGVPREEIKKFADSEYWLVYFPPIAVADMTAFGARIDWRRSFITTDINPYYDSFVRWQMNKLHALEKIKFGERYTIYSPKDGQPCMDHDRSAGEALGPQEYTAVKMAVVKWSDAAEKEIGEKIKGKNVFLVAATLRPETMYGQTNCFVGTALKYGLFAVNDTDVYLCTYRGARNMAFQGNSPSRGEIKQLAEIEGSKLIGTEVKAPFSLIPEVYVLPMDNVLATKGTGVVTSVPSDSPDDYQTLTDLRKKPEYYKIEASWASFDPVPVIHTPAYGDLTAETIVKQLKIQSQKDTLRLAEAKDLAYKEGFYNGTMIVGEFKGLSVQEAKPKVRARMIEEGLAFAYAEPEGLVISRSGDECVVALMDQWYLDYGEPSWKAQAEKLLGKMETYSDGTRHAFQGSLDWLNQWACARSFGLGSRLPWDPQFLVESLSDSTIYMSYYTVAHLLQGGVINGSKTGPLGVTPEQLTDEVWEYILGQGSFPSPAPLPREKADILKREFSYFYPMDIRSSGKDLVPNHLTFAIYNHAALFPEEQWPLSMRTNGHLMLNGKKMAKSTGNSLTLKQGVEKFGADATRIALADAGDSIEDANFDEKTANASILRLHTLVGWCTEMVEEVNDPKSGLRRGPKNSTHDRVFENEINNLIEVSKNLYETTFYKEALKYGFYELQSSRDWYREVTSDIGMHADLVQWWIRVSILIVLPVAPHYAEHIWTTLLKEPKSIQYARWPEISQPVDRSTLESGVYMREISKTIRDAEGALRGGIKKKGPTPTKAFDLSKPKSVRIFVATKFPEWQDVCVGIVKDAYDEKTGEVDDKKIRDAATKKGLMKDKRVMPFIHDFKKRIALVGAQTAFNRTLLFSEMEVLTEISPYMKRTQGFQDVELWTVEKAEAKKGQPGFTASTIDGSQPGSPGFLFWNP